MGYAKLEMLQHYTQDREYRNAATVQDRALQCLRANAQGEPRPVQQR